MATQRVLGSGTSPAHAVPDDSSFEVRLVGDTLQRIVNGLGGAGPADFPDSPMPAKSSSRPGLHVALCAPRELLHGAPHRRIGCATICGEP